MKRILFTLFVLLLPGLASAQIVNWGDYADTNQTIYLYFNTVGTDGVAETWDISGVTTTTAAVIYEDGSSTEITSAETVDNDFDSRTGWHQVAVDLSDAGFENGKTYSVVLIGATTVDSVSVTNRMVGVFTVGRYSTAADIADAVPTAAEINAEVVDALNTDTYAEPGQGAPAATASLAAKINYLYKAWRNKVETTSSSYKLYADDATTVDQKSTNSDSGTTFTKGEAAAGP